MKKYSNIFVALGVALFLLTVGIKSEAEAQCPSGTTHYVDTLTVGGCDYEVDMCVSCTVTHPGKVNFNSITPLDSSCVSTLTPEQQLQQVLSQTDNWAYIYFNACSQSFPPCDTTARRITFEYPLCWVVVLDTLNERYWYHPCDNSKCAVTYDICLELPGMTVKKTLVGGPTIINMPTCTLQGYQITYPTTHEGESECFILHTPCNPDGIFMWP